MTTTDSRKVFYDDEMEINMGPQHPSTHGVLRFKTITDGEIWLVHSVFLHTTTNFDCTGDDVTLVIGDGNDTDGFLAVADAELQAAFTEATGFQAGFFGIEAGSGDAYTIDDGGPFVYAPSGSDETIDWLLDETSGETITAGAATIYVVYTRIQ